MKSTSAENDNQVKSGDAKPDSMDLETEKESEPKADAKDSSEADEAEDDNKKNNTETKKTSANMYKDNKDVVLREDLKSIFEKFGTVKVCVLLSC